MSQSQTVAGTKQAADYQTGKGTTKYICHSGTLKHCTKYTGPMPTFKLLNSQTGHFFKNYECDCIILVTKSEYLKTTKGDAIRFTS